MSSPATQSNRPVRSRGIDLLGLAAALVVTFAIASFGAQFEPGEWYRQLAKPTWTPPGWLFPPVWTLLYISMATAVWLVWRSAALGAVRLPLVLYFAQLLCNGLWSWLFFGRQAIGLALVDIVVLLGLIVFTALTFRPRSRPAFRLFIPYIVWVSFASCLNLAIWLKN